MTSGRRSAGSNLKCPPLRSIRPRIQKHLSRDEGRSGELFRGYMAGPRFGIHGPENGILSPAPVSPCLRAPSENGMPCMFTRFTQPMDVFFLRHDSHGPASFRPLLDWKAECFQGSIQGKQCKKCPWPFLKTVNWNHSSATVSTRTVDIDC